MTADGKVYTAGDMKSEVSIQSISKVFTMAKVIEEQGPDAIANTIGVDATGMRFNSIVAIEFSQKALGGPEMNPLVNPGAIAATSMVKGATRDEVWKSILGYYSDFAGRPLAVNQEVFKSEADTNQRNQAIGYLMYAYGYIKANPLQATDVYTEQCSVSVNAKDLATMAATLANGGKNPVTGKQVMKADNVPKVLAVMATAGLYDDSGKWLFRTGPSRQERRRRRPHRRLARQVRDRGRSRRRSTRPATACARRRRSRTSRTRSAATLWRRSRDSEGNETRRRPSDSKTDVDGGRGRAGVPRGAGAGRAGRAERHGGLDVQRRRDRGHGRLVRIDPKDAFSWGARIGFLVNENIEIGAPVQPSSRRTSSCGGAGTRRRRRQTIYNYHGYFAYNFGAADAPVRPYFLGGLGATQYGSLTTSRRGSARSAARRSSRPPGRSA